MNYIKSLKIILTIAFLMLVPVDVAAQEKDNVIFYLYNAADSTVIKDGYVTLAHRDSVAYSGKTDPSEYFVLMRDVLHGKYKVEADAFGFDLFTDTIDFKEYGVHTIFLQPRKSIELSELTVAADRSATAERTVGGMMFYLSEKARKMKDPFKALSEIPALVSDVARGSIQTLSGKQPKILINGEDLNTGIAPLNPSEILSVEVITDPPVRYRQQGYSSVVNVTVKKRERPYVWTEANTRHTVPLDNGNTRLSFEVGNPRVSLFGKFGFDYIYNRRTESDYTRSNGVYSQDIAETKIGNERNFDGSLMLKGNPNGKNCYAVNLSGKSYLSKSTLSGSGYLDKLSNTYQSASREPAKILEGMAYYDHKFSEKETFSVVANYIHNSSKSEAHRSEIIGSDATNLSSIYDIISHHVGGQLYYNRPLMENISIGVGANIDYLLQDMRDMSESGTNFTYHSYNQYVYLYLNGQLFQKLSLSAALINNGTVMKDDLYSRGFWPFGCLVFADYVFDVKNSIRVNCSLSHNMPSITQLNPTNTSTDPLQKIVGNPDLRPMRELSASLIYTYFYKKWYCAVSVKYHDESDGIESYRYIDKDGVIVKTYGNLGRFRYYSAGAQVNYRLPFGRIYVGGGTLGHYYPDRTGNTYWLSGGFQFFVKRFSFYGDFTFRNKFITRYDIYTNYKPSTFSLQCLYEACDNLYIGVKVDNLVGTKHDKVVGYNGDYHMMTRRKFCYNDLRPTISLRYTFRANQKRRINLGEVLQSSEQPIRITQ